MKRPSSNGANGSGSGDDVSKEGVGHSRVDGESMHTATMMLQDNVDEIYISDSEPLEALSTGTAVNAQMAADLWLTDLETGEKDADSESNDQSDSAATSPSEHMAEFKFASAQGAADLWLSLEVGDADEGSDEEEEESDEESDNSDGAAALESGDIAKSKSALAQVAGALWLVDVEPEVEAPGDPEEVSDGAISPESNNGAHVNYASAQVSENLWLESEDVEEADDGADTQNSDHAGQSSAYLPGSWLDDDNVDSGVNSVGGDTHPTGSWLDDDDDVDVDDDDDVAVEEVTSVMPSKITLPCTYARGDFPLPSYLFMDYYPEVDMDD